ncbi:unnamed protein product [Menidia menidia]|uniref:(Atlantic silverside) hypothetical protein n=1 Tax=Menidia menidia TaxID=238744 RepID=A0A8S4AUN7_9TELE|nr:unnamed protein product [Menidia menidia]
MNPKRTHPSNSSIPASTSSREGIPCPGGGSESSSRSTTTTTTGWGGDGGSRLVHHHRLKERLDAVGLSLDPSKVRFQIVMEHIGFNGSDEPKTDPSVKFIRSSLYILQRGYSMPGWRLRVLLQVHHHRLKERLDAVGLSLDPSKVRFQIVTQTHSVKTLLQPVRTWRTEILTSLNPPSPPQPVVVDLEEDSELPSGHGMPPVEAGADEFDGWVRFGFIKAVKTALLHLLNTTIKMFQEETCYGCSVNHPSLRQHQCKDVLEDDFSDRNYHHTSNRPQRPILQRAVPSSFTVTLLNSFFFFRKVDREEDTQILTRLNSPGPTPPEDEEYSELPPGHGMPPLEEEAGADEFEGWVRFGFIRAVKTDVLHLLNTAIRMFQEETCFGCSVNHPSLRQHQCKEVLEDDFSDRNYHDKYIEVIKGLQTGNEVEPPRPFQQKG